MWGKVCALGLAASGAAGGAPAVGEAVGTIDLISRTPSGAAGNEASDSPAMSPDGRYVAFRSAASDLVPGDANGVADVFLSDRTTGVVRLVSAPADGGSA